MKEMVGDFRKDDEWWNKPIEEYEEQKNWACNKCGGCLPLRPRKSLNGTDDVSISNLQRLKKINSPKIQKENTKFSIPIQVNLTLKSSD